MISTEDLNVVAGIISSSMFVGANLVMSYLAVPALVLPTSSGSSEGITGASEQHVARQWQYLYDLGKKGGPFFALTAFGNWTYAALKASGVDSRQRLLFSAAVLSVTIVPWTLIVMQPTNDELIRRANSRTATDGQEGKSKNRQSTTELVKWWTQLNTIRNSFHVIGLGCAVTALTR